MKKYLLVFTIYLLPFLPFPALAQYINAYVTAGAITSQIEGDELKGFSHWGFHGGVGALVRFDDEGRWALSVESDYSARGVYNNLHNSQNLYNIDMTLHYVDIPLTFFYKDPVGGLRFGIGPVYSRLVQQPHGEINFRPSHFLPDTTDMSFLKNDLALAAEIRFPVWSNLYFSARYQYSLFPVKKGWSFTEGDRTWQNDCYNQSIIFRLLWQFGEPEKSARRATSSHRTPPRNKPRVTVRRRR